MNISLSFKVSNIDQIMALWGGGGIYLFIFLNLSQELIAVHGITALLQSNYILVHFVPVLSLSHRLFHFRFRYKYYESVIITPLSYTVGIIII
jgi:hypothetical protein